jgi:hypothetical protein
VQCLVKVFVEAVVDVRRAVDVVVAAGGVDFVAVGEEVVAEVGIPVAVNVAFSI